MHSIPGIPYLFISSFEEPFVWSENAMWPGDEWSINVFSGVQKMTNILWVRYDSIFNETAGGCKTCKMILKIIVLSLLLLLSLYIYFWFIVYWTDLLVLLLLFGYRAYASCWGRHCVFFAMKTYQTFQNLSLVAEMSWNLTVFSGGFVVVVVVLWRDVTFFIRECNMGHALWMALMSYEWHGINYFRKIAVMEYLSTK